MQKFLPNYLLLAPFMLLFGAFFLYPIVSGFYYSFYDWDGINAANFAGWKNYETVLTSRNSRIAATNLLTYVSITVPVGIAVALGLALLVGPFLALLPKMPVLRCFLNAQPRRFSILPSANLRSVASALAQTHSHYALRLLHHVKAHVPRLNNPYIQWAAH